MNEYQLAAERLLNYLFDHHWNGRALFGPDPIGKINWRVGRFLKSYTRNLPWRDRFEYAQGQGYWIRALSSYHKLSGDQHAFKALTNAADYLVSKQLPSGVWEHPPLRERRGFVSAVESIWACLGLAAAYETTQRPEYLSYLQKGFQGIVDTIGFQPVKDGLAVNYYAHSQHAVPNVTTMYLWLVAIIHKITGESRVIENVGQLIRFLEFSQLETGELSYVYESSPHFQCFQYNSFQFIDLANFYIITKNEQMRPILVRMAKFLSTGVNSRDGSRYSCFRENPEVNYWTSALAAALMIATKLDLGNYADISDRLFRHLLGKQRPDGSFWFSERNYVFLSDRRSYARQQAMILSMLLQRSAG